MPWVAMGLLAVLTVLAVVLQKTKPASPASMPDLPPDTLAWQERGTAGTPGGAETPGGPGEPGGRDPLSLVGKSTSDLLLQHPQDRVFEGEPADLPPFPDANAHRIGGIVRNVPPIREIRTQWQLPLRPVEQVISHYRAAADRAGFIELPSQPRPNTSSVLRVFLRRTGAGSDAAMQQTLTIFVTPKSDALWVTLVLTTASP